MVNLMSRVLLNMYGSAKQLDLDYIDLCYQHCVDVSVPIEDTMGELKKLVEEGKIKYIGLSEASAETVRRVHAVHPITAVQVEYSLWTRDIEEDIIPLCRELGIGIVAYSPLGRAFFGGKAVVESVPNVSVFTHFPSFTRENLEKNKQLYARLTNIAAKHNGTPPQLALAWRLHKKGNVLPIPVTTKVKNHHNTIGSTASKLTEEDLKEISDAVPMYEVSGDKGPDNLKKVTPIALMPIGYGAQLGFGCAGLSGVYNDPLSHETGCSIIKEAFSKGVTFFDTSDYYGQNYDNEIMLGKALKQFPREKVHLATKLGIKSEGREYGVNGTPEYVRQSCEASLKRLDLDYIDLYYQHHVDVSVPIVDVSVPIEDTISVTTFHLKLKKLVEEGKIKYIGLSKASTETVRRAHVVHPITAVQVEYSLWTRDIEEDIIPLCRPLGRGFFGGKGVVESMHTDSLLAHFPRYTAENLEKNKQLYSRLANIAAKHNYTPPQLALAWLLHQEDNVVPIPIPMDEVAGDRDLKSLVKFSRKLANTPAKS
ncbi:hypothetical protein TEA_007276 [Camellia sinensis var. sinensis]|uniref:NADP-dependent oxidoreductase domain-containing protein n=1 Tax=Camellia sinensis var. sinensis TaxID=542762 RepID=A0A4S4D4W8_CAMSN|nr:hypothetical protein TEA_007276 [Camellia sinensis var. sinensis]